MTLRDHYDKTANISAGNQHGTSFAIKQSTKMVFCKLVVILWIACSTTWVQAYVDDDELRNSLKSGDKYDSNRWNVEDDPWAGERRAHQRPSYGFEPNDNKHQDFHQPKFPFHPQQEDHLDLHWPEIHLKPHLEVPEIIKPPQEGHPDLQQPELHPELHPRFQGIKPQQEDLSNLYHPMVHPEPHPEVPEVINPPQEGHPDLQKPELHPELDPRFQGIKPQLEDLSNQFHPMVHPEPHPEVPEVINLPQEDHPDLYQPELYHPVPLAPYPVTEPNSGHLPTEAQPVTPVSNDSPHSAQTPEELYETKESSSTFSTEPSTQTEDNSLGFKVLVEPLTDSKSEESFMEMMQIPLMVGIFLGAMISLLILSTVVYVSCRSAKVRGEYAVIMSDLPKKNKEIAEV